MKQLPLFEAKNYCDSATSACIDIRFTGNCDSHCNFCIAAEDMLNKRDFDPEAMLESLKRVKDSGVTDTSILGGEPFLYLEQLDTFMEKVKAEAPHIQNIYLTSALPPTVKTKWEVFTRVMEKTKSLNVSVNHYEATKNNMLLQTRGKFDRISILKEIVSHEEYREKVRVHLNLVRGGIDNLDDLLTALYRLEQMGVKYVKINELMNAPDDYVSFEEITGEKFTSPYANGCSTPLEFYPNLDIVLKRSCFVVEPSLKASKMDLAKLQWKEEMGYLEKNDKTPRVIYEDGTVTDGWRGEPV